MRLTPTPKAASAGIAGAITYVIIRVLVGGFHWDITAEDGSAITTIVAFLAAYFAPRSKPTPEECDDVPTAVKPIKP